VKLGLTILADVGAIPFSNPLFTSRGTTIANRLSQQGTGIATDKRCEREPSVRIGHSLVRTGEAGRLGACSDTPVVQRNPPTCESAAPLSPCATNLGGRPRSKVEDLPGSATSAAG
jgi:hypothetical protein